MMSHYAEQHKIALISSLELVLMSMGNTKYHLVAAKLNAGHDMGIKDCYEHPEYLKPILKEVYTKDYDYIINEIKLNLDELINEQDISRFFKIMET